MSCFELVPLIFSLFVFILSQQLDDDVNKFLFRKDTTYEFVDLTHLSHQGQRMPLLCVDNLENSYNYSIPSKTKTIGDIPLKNLILPLIIADLSATVNNDSSFVLQEAHLDFMVNNYFGLTYQPCLVIFKFDWSKHHVKQHFRHYEYYEVNDVDKENNTSHPGISESLAKWLTRSYKNIVGVGVDTPSVDPSAVQGTPAMKAFIDAGLYVVNNVKLDQYLPEAACTALLSPIKTSESCSPYRLLAICPKSKMSPKEVFLHRI